MKHRIINTAYLTKLYCSIIIIICWNSSLASTTNYKNVDINTSIGYAQWGNPFLDALSQKVTGEKILCRILFIRSAKSKYTYFTTPSTISDQLYTEDLCRVGDMLFSLNKAFGTEMPFTRSIGGSEKSLVANNKNYTLPPSLTSLANNNTIKKTSLSDKIKVISARSATEDIFLSVTDPTTSLPSIKTTNLNTTSTNTDPIITFDTIREELWNHQSFVSFINRYFHLTYTTGDPMQLNLFDPSNKTLQDLVDNSITTPMTRYSRINFYDEGVFFSFDPTKINRKQYIFCLTAEGTDNLTTLKFGTVTNLTLIPVAINSNEMFIITPDCNIIKYNPNSKSFYFKKTDGKAIRTATSGPLRDYYPASWACWMQSGSAKLLSDDGACFDLAVSQNYLASVLVGGVMPKPSDGPASYSSFDFNNGSNYFLYLKVIKPSSVSPAINNDLFFLNAPFGRDGQDTANIDSAIFCTDKSIASLNVGNLKYIDFDKNENLFILTSSGKLLYYTKSQLDTPGLKVPKVFAATGLENIDFMSCGQGIVARQSGTDLLFYLSDDEVTQLVAATPPTTIPSWHLCGKDLKAATFKLTNSGDLILTPNGSDLYALRPEHYAPTLDSVLTTIDNDATLTDATLKNKHKLAAFCHIGLNQNPATYFGITLKPMVFPALATAADVSNFISKATTFFQTLASSFWQKEYASTFMQALSKIRNDVPAAASQLDTFEQALVTSNPLFVKVSLREKLQELQRLLTSSLESAKTDLQTKIAELIANTSLMLNNSSFNDIDSLLAAAANPVPTTPPSPTKIGGSLTLAWVRNNKEALLTKNIAQSDIDQWITTLADYDRAAYSDPSAFKPALILADIKASINLISSSISKDTLSNFDKTAILDALEKLSLNKTAINPAELSDSPNSCKSNLKILKNKFNLGATDKPTSNISDFDSLLATLSFDQNIICQMDQLQMKIIDTSFAATSLPDILTALQNIVNARAELVIIPLTNAATATDSKKTNFISWFSSQLSSNNIFVNYQKDHSGPDNQNFYFLLERLKDLPTSSDYLFSLVDLKKRMSSFASRGFSQTTIDYLKSYATQLVNKLKSDSVKKYLSANDLSTFNIAQQFLKDITLLDSITPLSSTDSPTFTTFANNISQDIKNNQSTTDSLWHFQSGSNTSFTSMFQAWDNLKLHPSFGINLNDNGQKFKLIGLIKYINASAKKAQSIASSTDPVQIRLSSVITETQTSLDSLLGQTPTPPPTPPPTSR